MRVLLSSAVTGILIMASACSFGSAQQVTGEHLQLTSTFNVDSPTEIPGKTLNPGQYTITVLDHFADRTILRVTNGKGKEEAVFIGLPDATLTAGRTTGPILWKNGPHNTEALRGFTFPGAAVEFAYPKQEAVAIAQSNSEQVPAIDPASEGRPVNDKLSEDDRRMVTLWMLSSTKVGPANNSQPAIQAQRYQPAITPSQYAQQATGTSSSLKAQGASSQQPARDIERQRPAPAVQQTASLKRPGMISTLPHTAGILPLLWLIGILAFLSAAGLRTMRKVMS